MLLGKVSEGGAWADFEQNPLRLFEQLIQACGKIDRLAQMIGPVSRVGGFGGGDPGAAY